MDSQSSYPNEFQNFCRPVIHPSFPSHHFLPCLAWQLQAPPLLIQSRPSLLPQPPTGNVVVSPIHIHSPSPYQNHSHSKSSTKIKSIFTASVIFAIKAALLIPIVSIYSNRQQLNQPIVLALYCCHLYIGVELILAATAAPVRLILGLEMETQFNEPYLATSLQDFWGRRWNLMVTSILRPTVYNPVRDIFAPFLGKDLSLGAGIMSTFLVSGLMHEIIYYYLSRASPTWEVTWFFVLHGFCVAAEIVVKKALKKKKVSWRLHRVVSRPLTIGFVGVTGAWLFFPQIVRNGLDLKVINENIVLFCKVGEKFRIHGNT
ncbi:OLC1v1022605C1 [Oldenlandia corymbosa var. corymbosa]|uniref:OLC1v1022605C1 n=1 Tax=Oldenlandia corymbosa var. corymbosa TaxID=529605 RepID=A0AAV1C0L2_OLDCO|nr:OLC1v1022605C1 [Oldenlandia corymbosa var. corymbosa]